MLEQHLACASPDLLREMIASFANAMMCAQADQACGAGYGERSGERVNRRNGYPAREWDTRAGTVELAIPKTSDSARSQAAAWSVRPAASPNALIGS
jgi:transposase-like protein